MGNLHGEAVLACVPTSDGFRLLIYSPRGAKLLDRSFVDPFGCHFTSRTDFNSDFTLEASALGADDGSSTTAIGAVDTSGDFHAIEASRTEFTADLVFTEAFAPGTDTEWWASFKDVHGTPATIGRDATIVSTNARVWDSYPTGNGRSFDFVWPSGAGTPLGMDDSGQAEDLESGDIEINNQFNTLIDDGLRCQHHSRKLIGASLSMPDGQDSSEPVYVNSDCSQLAYLDSGDLWVAPTTQIDPIQSREVASLPAHAVLFSFTKLG